jgi:hypothetical protein
MSCSFHHVNKLGSCNSTFILIFKQFSDFVAFNFYIFFFCVGGGGGRAHGVAVVKALYYEPEDRGFQNL